MCCSVSPRIPVHFSNTVLYGAEVTVGREAVHVLGYQNKVQDRVGRSSAWSMVTSFIPAMGPGNAMILPFPAAPKTMTAANVVDTKACKDILQDMAKAVASPPTLALSRSPRLAAAAPRVQVFHAAGIYTVVLAQDARDIPAALDQVPRAKRPELNSALFEAYANWYPD